MKVCTKCAVEKPFSEYYKHNGPRTSPGYINPSCKTCQNAQAKAWAKQNPDKVKAFRRKAKLKEKYNVSLEQYEEMFVQQKGVCAVCLHEHKRRPLNVDHNHLTGKVRGLLCDKCNMSLGLLSDSKERIKALLNYMENYD
jgi:hypothetical protein